MDPAAGTGLIRDPDGYRCELIERVPDGVIDQPGTGQGAT
jgi:hypothetical protein